MSLIKRSLTVLLALSAIGCSRSPAPADSNRSAGHQAAAAKSISEDQALALLVSRLKAHKVADIDCLEFLDEGDGPPHTTAAEWEFAAHENHNERCGGDPDTSPVRDRYKVNAAGAVQVYNAAEAEYRPL